MKKILSSFLAIIMLLTFVSCSNDNGDSNTEDTSEAVVDSLACNIADGYTIVVSETATSAVKNLSNTFVKAIKEKTDIKLERVTDNNKKNTETPKEILFGLSKREETKTALELLTTTGYSISFNGEKLVVVATNDFMLEKAVGALIEKLSFDGSVAKIDKNINLVYDGSSDMIPLVENGNFKYQIIYPYTNTYGERDAANDLRLNLNKTLDCVIPVVRYDSGAEVNDDAFELLIGETNRPQSKALYDNIGANNLKVEFSGNKILVGSSIPTDISRALNKFYTYIVELVNGTYDGKYMLPCGYQNSEVSYEWMNNIPMMSTGTLVGVDDTGKESMVYVWNKVTESDYESYLSELKSSGLTEKQTYALGDNRYMLLENQLAQVYVYYTSANKTVRLFVETKENLTVYPSATPSEYVTEQGYEPTLWQVECDWKTALEWDTSLPEKWRGSNGGMCYMLKVADGSFVIIDSGMNSKKQADIIWEHLKANSDDEKPVISAWYFSHTHADHIGGFQQFTKYYKDQVTVKAFYFNVPAEGFGTEGGTGDTNLISSMKQYTGATIYRKLHTGMTFYVADARFDVMYTHEDLYPVISEDFNETSTVIRVTFGGKRIMFLGDVQDDGGKVMTDTMPKSEMKSDIVQYSHHGWDGPQKELYDHIEAPIILWPNAIYSWQKDAEGENIFDRLINRNGGSYFYVVNHYIAYEAEYVKSIYVNAEGTGTQEFILTTFTPRAERLPDYVKIHNEIKAREEATA